MTTPLKVKRRTINNYAETIDVNWDCPRQTRVSCRPPYWYLNWPPNLKHSLIVVKLFMGAGGGGGGERESVRVCVCVRACMHPCTNGSEVCTWFHWRLGGLQILLLIGIYFLRHYFFLAFQFNNKTASTKHQVN